MTMFDFRRQRLLDLMSQQHDWLTAKQLYALLQRFSSEWQGALKTLKRDLQWLEEQGLVNGQEQSSGLPILWKISKYHHEIRLLPTEAMTLAAIFDHAERFGFATHLARLAELRDFATRIMRHQSRQGIDLNDRITTGTRFLMLRPGRYDAALLTRIQEAIWHNEPLAVTYRPRDADDARCIYQLKPLALSHQDSNTYLSAWVAQESWLDGYQPNPHTPRGKYSSNGPGSLCALMLHRIVSIDTGRINIPDPEGYDVHSVEAQRHLMTLHDDTPVQLELRLSPNLYNRLSENPISDDQTLEPTADGRWTLTCDLHDSQGLRLFLLSNAADIEVVRPAALRAHVREKLEQALGLYQA